MAAPITPEQRAKQNGYARAWTAANPDKKRESGRAWAASHPEAVKAKHRREYLADSPEQRKNRNDASKRWAKRNPEANCEKVRRYLKIPANRMKMAIGNARRRAERYGLCFEAALELLVSTPPSECACCQVCLSYSTEKGRNRNLSPSLDRRDNKKGYTIENTRVLCNRCNSLKKNASIEEIERLLAYMRS